MALSTRKKNIIIADWKTGAYSLNSLAKKHKISVNTVKKICTNIEQSNAHIIAAYTEVAEHKNCIKNAQEIKSIEYVVENRIKVSNMTNKVLDKLNESLNKGKAQKVVVEGQGMGISNAQVIEYDMQPEHYEKAMNTIDKASITLGVNSRFNTAIQVNTDNKENSTNVDIVGYGVKTIEG